MNKLKGILSVVIMMLTMFGIAATINPDILTFRAIWLSALISPVLEEVIKYIGIKISGTSVLSLCLVTLTFSIVELLITNRIGLGFLLAGLVFHTLFSFFSVKFGLVYGIMLHALSNSLIYYKIPNVLIIFILFGIALDYYLLKNNYNLNKIL